MNTTFATTILPEKMVCNDPVPIEVGACGTVGSLVMKEIEYFRRLEASCGGGGCDDGKYSVKNAAKPNKRRGDGDGSNFWSHFGFLTIIWRRGKSKGGGNSRCLPRMCTMLHVALNRHHDHKLNKNPRSSYRNLKDDINQFKL
ncbi:hypothetical protein QVD17_17900 [Tagetes erecta]|uniref:Uncharacterized protein n=1 Tax=Tagetes erecta TaxID=13708 RepID=A0AAD8KGS9_TARER|nr:hypothetical protein QVD17_17900 [Tagetes erecta]